MLNVDAPRIRSSQIANELFVGWRVLERILGDNFDETLCLYF